MDVFEATKNIFFSFTYSTFFAHSHHLNSNLFLKDVNLVLFFSLSIVFMLHLWMKSLLILSHICVVSVCLLVFHQAVCTYILPVFIVISFVAPQCSATSLHLEIYAQMQGLPSSPCLDLLHPPTNNTVEHLFNCVQFHSVEWKDANVFQKNPFKSMMSFLTLTSLPSTFALWLSLPSIPFY